MLIAEDWDVELRWAIELGPFEGGHVVIMLGPAADGLPEQVAALVFRGVIITAIMVGAHEGMWHIPNAMWKEVGPVPPDLFERWPRRRQAALVAPPLP